jgi:hypothetical protein
VSAQIESMVLGQAGVALLPHQLDEAGASAHVPA